MNDYCVQGMAKQAFKRQPGHFETHNKANPVEVEWEGFAIEVTTCRRARVVCNVPTPYSLFTFNYCLKRDGRQLAHGTTTAEFLTHALRAAKKFQQGNA